MKGQNGCNLRTCRNVHSNCWHASRSKERGFSAPIRCQQQQLQGANIVESQDINVLIVGTASGMNAVFWFSAGLLAYVYAMMHLGTAMGWNCKFFGDMKSKDWAITHLYSRLIGRRRQ